MGEILHRVVQGLGKGLDKRAAAGGTSLVELDAVYRLILDLDAFHILSADVQDTVHVRLKEGGGIVVGHRFHLSLVHEQGGLDERLPVTGRAGVYDLHLFRQFAVDVLDGGDGGA